MPRTANPQAPFLTHVVSHHGQLTLIPPQNAGRLRKSSPTRSARYDQREGRSPSGRSNSARDVSAVSSSPARRTRSPRSQTPTIRRPILPHQNSDLTVPDFPPPSFQEAISAPLYLIPTPASLSVASFSSYHSVDSRSSSEASYPTTSASSPTEASIYEDANEDDVTGEHSDSDSLHGSGSRSGWEEDLRQGLPLRERVLRERERREMAESSPSMLTRQRTCSHCGGGSRVTDDEDSVTTPPSTVVSSDQHDSTCIPAPVARRRLLRHKHSHSLSTASVPSTPTGTEQPVFPSCESHRRSRSMSPTRPSSPSSEITPRSSLRRLFSISKGKERPSSASEPLHAWEILDRTPSGSAETLDEPQSSSSLSPSPSRVLRRTLSKMNLNAISSTLDLSRQPAIEPYPLQQMHVPQVPPEKSRSHLPPIQDRPPPPIPPAFQTRPMRAPPAPPPIRMHSPLATNVYAPFSEPSVSPPPSPSPSSKVDPTKKRRPPPPPPHRSAAPSISDAIAQRGTRQRFQSMAVRTPPKITLPPPSPLQDDRVQLRSNFEAYKANPFSARAFAAPSYRSASPQSELSYATSYATAVDEPEKRPGSGVSSLTIRPPGRGPIHVDHYYENFQSPISPVSPISATSSGSPASASSARSGHHYPGRPLPLPPPGSPVVPTAFEQVAKAEVPFIALDEKAPARLADAQLNGSASGSASVFSFPTTTPPIVITTPSTPSMRRPSPCPSVATSTSSITEYDESRDRDRDEYRDDDTETINSEATDLDLLIARIDGDSEQGDSYEDLLLVSEVLGRATPTQEHRHENRSQSGLEKSDIIPFVGRVEVKRRRVMKNGRVKLKLSLLGVAVDNCGVCLSQFRDEEWAALGPQCQHSYHERCLKKWLARSHACPLCRVPLDEN